MKLTTFILMITLMQVSAATFGQNLTLKERNVTLKKVLWEIQKQTGYDVLIGTAKFQTSQKIDANFKDTPLTLVMDNILKGSDLSYSIEEKTVIIKEKEKSFFENLAARFQAVDVRGRIIGENGQPLVGATITVKGTDIKLTSGANGEFFIQNVDENAMLDISFIGYQAKQMKAGKELGNIRLEVAISDLEEVKINAGYYAVSDKERTGNISRISAEDIEKQPISNPLAAMQGRVPGLVISQGSGTPGSGFKVQIRGQGSLVQGTEPFFVIDGVPFSAGNTALNTLTNSASSGYGLSPLNMINPNDIESIEILKDADATAIYGSRGANGVILITTKKGMVGESQISANIYSGFSRVTRSMDMLNTQQYLEMRSEAFKNDGVSPTAGNAPDLLAWDNERYTDFKKLLIGGTAHATDAQLSLNGGNSDIQYVLSGGYHKENTVFPGDQSANRGSFHLNLNHHSSDKKLSISFQANYSASQSNLTGADLTQYIVLPPNLLLYNNEGKLNWQEAGITYTSVTNPLAELNKIYVGKFRNLVSSLNISYEVFEGARLKTNFGYNTTSGEEQQLNPSTSINPNFGALPSALFGESFQNSWIIEPQIEYSKKIGLATVNFIIGSTFQSNNNNSLNVNASDYKSDILLGSIGAAGSSITSNYGAHYKYNALYSRFNFNWGDKYILNLTGRRDGSSRFGPDKKFANFGAIGGAWIFTNEPLFSRLFPFLTFGKFRGSYGVTGNDQIGNYKYLNTWTNSNQPYQGIPGLQPSSLYNPDFTWEKNTKREIAIELAAVNNRIVFSLAYFRSRSSNQLINYKLPSQTGFAFVLRNWDAVVQNSGLEFSLTTRIVSSASFNWTIAGNLTVPKNRLVSFPDLSISTYANTFTIGESLSSVKRYKYLGVNSQTGLYSFMDVNNDGVYDASDRVIIKNTDPKFYGGVQNTFTYKAFQLDLFLEYKKQQGLNYLNSQRIPFFSTYNQPLIILNRWQNPGDSADIQRLGAVGGSAASGPAVNLGGSEAIFSDASFIRLKNMAFSYSFSSYLLKKIHLKSLKLFIQGQNLLTITNYIGADPENQNLYVLPPLRTIAGGIQLTL